MFSFFPTLCKTQNIDINLLKSINGSRNNILRSYSLAMSNSAGAITVAVPLSMGAIAVINKDDDLLKSSLTTGLSLGLNCLITYSLKKAVNRPRPYITYPNDIEPYERLNSESFPSMHTSVAFSTATALCLIHPRWYVIVPSALWACSVGYSRLNLGVHYPSDVLAGAVIGTGSTLLVWQLNKWYRQKNHDKRIITTW